MTGGSKKNNYLYNNNDVMIINVDLSRCKFLILEWVREYKISKLEMSRYQKDTEKLSEGTVK